MPKIIDGKTLYSTLEASELVGVSKQTLLRWFREERVIDVSRDRNNWRVFSGDDIDRIRRYANRIRHFEEQR